MDVTGKVVLITGAAGGIGLATARLFAQRGAKLALVDRLAEKLEHVVSELPDAIALPIDMHDEVAVRRMIVQAEQHYGRIDVLINNAAQGLHVPIEKVDLNLYRSIFELNVVSVIAAMQAVIPIMRVQGGGVIVNISSGSSKVAPDKVRESSAGPYASTKYALNAITLAARQELAPDNIHVGLVYPWLTATDFNSNRAQQTDQKQSGAIQLDTPEYVAGKILEAVETTAAEVYAENLKKSLS